MAYDWKREAKTLVIEGPSAQCGSCRFRTALTGTWSVEDGLLVWRGAPDPQPRRGPDLLRCSESGDCPDEFGHVRLDDLELSGEQIAALRASADQGHDYGPPSCAPDGS
jgi:hypothetical protein